MSLRLWRKTKGFYHPGHFAYKKRNPWHTRDLTAKIKKLFSKNQKFYSAELRSAVPISSVSKKTSSNASNGLTKYVDMQKLNLVLQQKHNTEETFVLKPNVAVYTKTRLPNDTFYWNLWRMQNLQLNPFIWRSLFNSGFWVFNYPMAVPGAVKIRRSKNLFATQKNAVHNLNFFMHRVGFGWLKNLYQQNQLLQGLHLAQKQSAHQTNSLMLMKSFERFWPNCIYKLGLALSMKSAEQVFTHQLFTINGRQSMKPKVNAGTPADFLTFQSFNHLMLQPHYKSFHGKMFKYFKSIQISVFVAFGLEAKSKVTAVVCT